MNKYKVLSIVLAVGIIIVGIISYSPREYRKINPFYSCSATYVSGTGTAGTANTAQTVITRTFPANTLTQVGDRVRVRVYFFSAVNAAITTTIKINGVSVASISVATPTVPDVMEVYLHYIDNTHANVLEQEVGVIGSLSAINVSGFSFSSSQNITIEQTAVVNNFITIYGVFVDILPKYSV